MQAGVASGPQQHQHQQQGGDMPQTPISSDIYVKAFRTYLRNGSSAQLDELMGPDEDGGYSLPPDIVDKITKALFDRCPLRQLASVLLIAPGTGGMLCTPSGLHRTIHANKLYAQPKATQELVDDLAMSLECWLSDRVADMFAIKENEAFLRGSGIGQPHGILTAATRKTIEVVSSDAGGVTSEGICRLFYALPEHHSPHARFILNRTTAQEVRLLQDPVSKSYLWQPGLAANAPDTLMGVPVTIVNEMPSPGSGELSVAIGNFREGYGIVDQPDIRVLRDPFTERPFVKFYASKSVGGDVLDPSAIKVLGLAA